MSSAQAISIAIRRTGALPDHDAILVNCSHAMEGYVAHRAALILHREHAWVARIDGERCQRDELFLADDSVIVADGEHAIGKLGVPADASEQVLERLHLTADHASRACLTDGVPQVMRDFRIAVGGGVLSGTVREWADLDEYSRRSIVQTLASILVEDYLHPPPYCRICLTQECPALTGRRKCRAEQPIKWLHTDHKRARQKNTGRQGAVPRE